MAGVGLIARQFQRGEDRSEEQPRAIMARDEIGVLALPAEPGGLRQRLLHHRRGATNTLTSPPAAASSQRASVFSRFLMSSW